ncbi:hypothetical protein UNH65_04375 [Chitinophaga sp. 180180018-2]|nr:hypothetical protein [Chitinophaga sp. 212800010-3]
MQFLLSSYRIMAINITIKPVIKSHVYDIKYATK